MAYSISCRLQHKQMCLCCFLQKGWKAWCCLWLRLSIHWSHYQKSKKLRWGERKSSAKPLLQQTSKPVGKHFSHKGHEVHDMAFIGIRKVRSKNFFFLKARESYLIKQCDSGERSKMMMMYCGIFCPSCYYRFAICVQIHSLNQNIASILKRGEARWKEVKRG